MHHALKTDPIYFNEVLSGNKNFELRKADRPFAKGDTLLLQEYDRETRSYSGREIELNITHVLRSDEIHGIMKNYCVISFSKGILLNTIAEEVEIFSSTGQDVILDIPSGTVRTIPIKETPKYTPAESETNAATQEEEMPEL